MKTFEFQPKGVCASKMIFDMDGDVITRVQIVGGCAGNLLGISRIIQGKTIQEVVESFGGVRCGVKPTSCPDQIAQALLQYQKTNV